MSLELLAKSIASSPDSLISKANTSDDPPGAANPSEPSETSDGATLTQKKGSGEHLESISRRLLNVCLNLKDSNHPLIHEYQHPDFRNKHDALPKSASRDDHLENLQKHLAEQQDFHCEIHNTSSEVDENRGRATVYLWYEITGLAHGIEREAVAVLSWERRQGRWMLMKHTGLRGSAGFC